MNKVKTDEAFFNRFKELGFKIGRLSYMFQNENVETCEEEIDEWNKIANELEDEFYDLIDEANMRMEG